MASPFAFFRKHEKELMVIMTGIAMFCFVILDSVVPGRGKSGGGSFLLIPMIFAALGSGVAWIHGQITKKSSTYWINGLVIGGCLGGATVLFSLQGEPGISTAVGKINPQAIAEMKHRRQQANQIMDHLVFLRDMPESQFRDQMLGMFIQRYRFGGASTREVFMNHLLIKEADRLGIELSDSYVQKYLLEVSDKKLDRQRFEKLRRELQTSESQIFELVRQELRARLAYQVLNPEVVYMPEQYWQDFQKFNVKHSIEATAIPVEPFAKSAEAPQEAQLKTFFAEFKDKFPAGDQPGFRQQERKQVAYLTAEVEALEKEAGEPTVDALKALYEERKDSLFKDTTLPESPAEKATGESKPDAAAKDESTKDKGGSEPPPAAEDKSATEKNVEDKKTEDKKADEQKTEDKKVEETKADAKKSDDAQCVAEDPPAKTESPKADADKPAEAAKPDAAKPAEELKVDPAKADAAATKDVSDKPAESTEKPNAEKSPDETPDLKIGDSAPKSEPVKYKSFDDVKDQLRDLWLRDQVQNLAKKRLEDASTYINLQRTERGAVEPSNDEAEMRARQQKADAIFAAELSTKVKSYAKANGLTYAESTLQTFNEMMEDRDNPLSFAREPFDISSITDFRNIPTPKRVPERVFSGASVSFIPENAEGGGGDQQFVFWIIQVVDEHEPKFEDAGIRDQVEKAWRMKESRSRADKRANEFAELVGKGIKDKPMSEVLGEQTVTGEKDAQQLSVISSAPFTWLRQSFAGLQSNPFGGRQIEFGSIPGIDNIDSDFMKTVAQMAVGDVKVIPNADKTIFYVVHLKARTPSDANDTAHATQLKQFIDEHPQMMNTYDQLARPTFSVVQGRWFEDFMKKYEVNLTALDNM